MPRFAANLSMLYAEWPFLERPQAAAADGFQAVECLFPYEVPAAELRARLIHHGLRQVLFNAPAGDWQAGERGLASLPGREAEFRASVDTALDYARVLECRTVHVMAGRRVEGAALAHQREVLLENLAYAARLAAADGVTLVLEPLNPRDAPGYWLNRQDEAQSICAQVGAANLKVQFDCYHCQIVEGDVSAKLARDIASIGHVQIAGVPDRHEPDTGELHYPYLFDLLDGLDYQGWVGCEYRPRAGTRAGLGWLRPYLPASADGP